MALAVAIDETWHDGKRQHVIGTITPSGNYATGGDDLDFSSEHEVKSALAPAICSVEAESGFIYRFVKGTKASDNKLKVLQGDNDNAGDAPAVELPAAAYPAGVSGDTIRFHAVFQLK